MMHELCQRCRWGATPCNTEFERDENGKVIGCSGFEGREPSDAELGY